MNRWIDVKDGQLPRKGELFMVRDAKSIYPKMLVADGPLDWYVVPRSASATPDISDLVAHGDKLSFHGITQWTLLESPY